MFTHQPVMINETIKNLVHDPAGTYLDCTFGLGGHSKEILENYRWPGNIRQLKNIAEQISVIEENRLVTRNQLLKYLPEASSSNLPVIIGVNENEHESFEGSEWKKEREILYKALFDMKKELGDLKGVVAELVRNRGNVGDTEKAYQRLHLNSDVAPTQDHPTFPMKVNPNFEQDANQDDFDESHEVVEESLSLAEREKEFIIKALEKHRGRRKNAAKELGISERTLYRKIKEYNIQQ